MTTTLESGPARSHTWYGYTLLLLATVGLFFLVRAYGETLPRPTAVAAESAGRVAGPAGNGDFVHLLVALAAVIGLGRLLAIVCARIGQPPVIGEVLAGICLGPSLLGQIWPAAAEFVLPADSSGALATVAQLGVLLYMFVVGLELNAGLLRGRGQATVAISHASIVVPFILGALLAVWLYADYSYEQVSFTAFALFLAVAMSITAFPVLARILHDRHLTQTDLGVMALACAAIDDLSAWCLLALVIGVTQAQVGQALAVTVLAVGYVFLMWVIVRPLVHHWLARRPNVAVSTADVAVVLLAVLVSALTTEAIGIHAIFGAFLLGAIVPHDSSIARELVYRWRDFITTLLLPAFFALTGMRTQISLVSDLEAWLVCLAIIVVATLGKFGGTLAAARFVGIDWRTGASLSILMNTRGLMGLVVLNIGLDLGVISPALFAMMVIMALVTTMATAPILKRLLEPATDRTAA